MTPDELTATTTKVEKLVRARDDYLKAVSPFYDESLTLVTAAVAESGSIGKVDIGALVLWKRLRADTQWAGALNEVPETRVREVTAEAVAIARDTEIPLPEAARQSRAALKPLPGFRSGPALASALLVAAAPQRMAIYDRRANGGLKHLGIELPSVPSRYGQYIACLDDLVSQLADAGHQWTPRYVDTALYWLGRPNPVLAT